MGYTTVRGGEKAIRAAEQLEAAAAKGSGLSIEALLTGMRHAVDQVMGEAGLYAPELAARAVAEAQGNLAEAAFMLRAYRSTLPRVGYTQPADTGRARLIRRVSSAFKDVPGGQILGSTRDYSQRLLGQNGVEGPSENGAARSESEGEGVLPRVTDLLREAGLVKGQRPLAAPQEPFDLTRESLKVPASRSARLQGLARGEAGAMTALAYSSLRGFGAVHPTLAEFRVGYMPLEVKHPRTGEAVEIGEIACTETEAIKKEPTTDDGEERPEMSLGYGLVLGKNERKAISMAILDAAIRVGNERAVGPAGPAEDEEFVLYHVDGIEATGFVEHLKLPHYVTFQSSLDRVRGIQKKGAQVEGR